MIISSLKPVKRITELEKVTGIYQFEDFEEHEATIPEQIKELANRIEQPLHKPVEPKTTESLIPKYYPRL